MENSKYLSELSEDELKNIKYKIFSLYPLIYYKLVRFKNINFNIKERRIEATFRKLIQTSIFNGINGENIIYQCNYLLKELISSIFLKEIDSSLTFSLKNKNFYSNLDLKEKIIDFSKLFFPYDSATKDCFLKSRSNVLVKKKKSDECNDKVFLHDGWWNNYYGPIVDTESMEFLSKEISNKKLIKKRKKENIILYYRTFITYAYRLVEIDEFKKTKKLLKTKLKFFLTNLFFFFLKEETVYTTGNKLSNIIFSYIRAFLEASRFKTNYLMLLYRLEKKNKKKLKIIKKIDKINDYQKISFKLRFLKTSSRTIGNLHSLIRPQQILKSIEYSVDKYIITKDKETLTYINFLITEFAKSIYYNYYSIEKNYFLSYSIFFEFFFSLFYIMEKIYNINIQEY